MDRQDLHNGSLPAALMGSGCPSQPLPAGTGNSRDLLLWGIDNNFGRKLSGRDPLQSIAVEGMGTAQLRSVSRF